ncbi:transposase [bacterium]|nr:transposase [bacterium]
MYKVEMMQKYSDAPQWRSRGYLPHYTGHGSLQFVTYRTADSLPKALVYRLLQGIPASQQAERRQALEELLDQCHGACALRIPAAARVVQDNLLHHDSSHYHLLAWCVMANHVHMLIELVDAYPLSKVMHGCKSYTGGVINRLLGREGAFWEREYFDRAIRDDDHLRRTVEYIEANPVLCGICRRPEDFAFSSARWRIQTGSFELYRKS